MKNKYIPLVVADILMFFAVLAIAYPNIILMETMSAVNVALCCLLVISGMCLVLAPFIFEHLEIKQKISKDTKKVRYDIDLIFENLSALQRIITETKEANEQVEETLSLQLAKDLDAKFETFQKAVDTIRDSIKSKFKDFYEVIEQAQESAANVSGNVEIHSNALADISERMTQITELLDDLEQRVYSIEKESDLSKQAQATQTDSLVEDTEISEESNIQISDEQTQQDNSTFEDEKFFQEDLEQTQQEAKLSGLMSKALGNAMSTAASVEKLIAASNKAESTQEPILENQIQQEVEEDSSSFQQEIEDSSPEADEIENENDFQDYEIVPEEQDAFLEDDFITEPNQEESEQSFQNDINEFDFDDIAEQTNKNEFFAEDLDFEDIDTDSKNTSAETKKNKTRKSEVTQETTHIPFDELFANVAVEKKQKLTKADTAVTLHALIGIGNKPYLRSSSFEDIAMDYVEIGVWRAILPQFEGELQFTIWKNNEEQIGDQLYTVASGQKQEISL